MTAAGATCGLTLHLTAGNDIFPSENTSVKAVSYTHLTLPTILLV